MLPEGDGPVRQSHGVAEQLASVVRLSVEVLVQHQERVRLVDPPRELVEAVGVQVNKIRRILQLHLAVAVQSQDQQIAAGRGSHLHCPRDNGSVGGGNEGVDPGKRGLKEPTAPSINFEKMSGQVLN